MRILLLTNGLGFGGAERIVEALADDLRNLGDEVRIVATTRGGPIADSLKSRDHPVDILGIRSPWDASVVGKLARLVRSYRPEVLHSHLAVSDIASAASRPFTPSGMKRICTVHNPGVELRRVKRWLWTRALRAMDHVNVVSHSAQAKLPANLPSSILHPSLINLGDSLPNRAEARTELGLDPRVPLVLAIGRLSRIKGHDVLAQAAEGLRTKEAVVAVIGDGPARTKLSATRLKLLGSHPDAGRLVTAADVLVLPSRSEGFPQVPLHAMAASIPIVATKVGGTPEIVENEKTGLLVPPEDPRALGQAIDRVLSNTDLAEALGRAGRTRLIERGLTRTSMVAATRETYRSL